MNGLSFIVEVLPRGDNFNSLVNVLQHSIHFAHTVFVTRRLPFYLYFQAEASERITEQTVKYISPTKVTNNTTTT